MADKVLMFIDGSNLFWGAKNTGIKIDYGKMRDKLVKGRTLIRPYFYCAVGYTQMRPNQIPRQSEVPEDLPLSHVLSRLNLLAWLKKE